MDLSPTTAIVRPAAGRAAQVHDPRAKRETRPARGARLHWNFAEWFVLSLTFVPALLYLPGSQAIRIPIRMASYGISLGALVYCLVRQDTCKLRLYHPSFVCLVVAMGYLALMIVHPNTNTFLAAVAQLALYVSVLAPVIWAPAFVKEPARLRRLLWLLLLCGGINSFVGVMQVRDPGTWMPREFSSVMENSEFGLGTAIYEGADGQMIIRPPGLLDAPGAVSIPAVFSLFLGLVFVVESRAWWKRLAALTFAALGAAALFFTLVRSSFLIAVGMLLVYWLLQIRRRFYGRAMILAGVASATIVFAYLRTSAVGGDALASRFGSITEENPLDFYYENRGGQMMAGFTDLLPRYPLGAGLGRWGMMNSYFGDAGSTNSPPIWVEIQFPAWIVDGGIVLLGLYSLALILAVRREWWVSLHARDQTVRGLGGIILAANCGMLALCFSYVPFLSPVGMQFWFLAGALHGVAGKASLGRR